MWGGWREAQGGFTPANSLGSLYVMKAIEESFNRDFANFDIRLPTGAVAARQGGRIVTGGWTIWYTFGSDGETEYLDYYASHRMTNDRHIRLYADGREERLETMREGYVVPEDPEEAARAKADAYAHNKAVRRMLDEKGFTLDDDVHGSVLVNHWLLTGGDDDQSGSGETELRDGS